MEEESNKELLIAEIRKHLEVLQNSETISPEDKISILKIALSMTLAENHN